MGTTDGRKGLNGRVSLISGASKGLGPVMALALSAVKAEIVTLPAYLCSEVAGSETAGFITGMDILIDGGWCAC